MHNKHNTFFKYELPLVFNWYWRKKLFVSDFWKSEHKKPGLQRQKKLPKNTKKCAKAEIVPSTIGSFKRKLRLRSGDLSGCGHAKNVTDFHVSAAYNCSAKRGQSISECWCVDKCSKKMNDFKYKICVWFVTELVTGFTSTKIVF